MSKGLTIASSTGGLSWQRDGLLGSADARKAMAGTDRRSSLGTGIDRRTSMRLSMHQADDNEYDLDAAGISDGFRPAAVDVGTRRDAVVSQQNGRQTPPPRPSSTTKPKYDSFALRHDGAMGSSMQRNSMSISNAVPTRSSSVSTDVPYMRPESPYRGPAGPSHPYQMYPQESRLARTASTITTSTVQVPDRPYNGPGGPTHPYGMYPQNTVPEGVAASAPMVTVPVGFPGLQRDYQRRLGPEGEEVAGIIGPDGHTEELPPYTQYPEEAFARKTRSNAQVLISVPISGAGGIGLATRNPEFASQEDLHSPSRQSTRSVSSDRSSHHQVNMAARGITEKQELTKWQQFARKKIGDIIPVWAIALAAIVLILFGIILGVVLAVLKATHPLNHHNTTGDDPESVVSTTMTTTFDASPLTRVPTGLPTLPTGTFNLQVTAPYTSQSGCLTNSAQSNAWSCNIPMTSYTITVSPLVGSKAESNEVDLSLGNNSFSGWYAYGSQPPLLPTAQVLSLVTDNQEPSRGPAWFFELPYDKLVILPENSFATTNQRRDNDHHNKRDSDNGDGHSPSSFIRKNVAEPGDKPWFCYWNGTLLEAFIYVTMTSAAGSRQSAAWSSMLTESSSAPTSTSNQVQATSAYGSSVPTSAQSESSNAAYSGSSSMPYSPPAFPKVLKIEERRFPLAPKSIQPYCVQKLIDTDGNPTLYLNSTTNQPNIIYLNETEPATVPQLSGKRDEFGYLDVRASAISERQSSNSCGCVWLWT